MPLPIKTNPKIPNWVPILKKLFELNQAVSQSSASSPFSTPTETYNEVDALFRTANISDLLDIKPFMQQPENQRSGQATLDALIVFEVIMLTRYDDSPNPDLVSFTYVVPKSMAESLASQLQALLKNVPAMFLRRDLKSINYDIHESQTIFTFEQFVAKLLTSHSQRTIHSQYRIDTTLSDFLKIMTTQKVINELASIHLSFEAYHNADSAPIFFNQLKKYDQKITKDEIQLFFRFLIPLQKAKLN